MFHAMLLQVPLYLITYRYIDLSCHNFENCWSPRLVSQSCLGLPLAALLVKEPKRQIVEGDNFQGKCSTIQCTYI